MKQYLSRIVTHVETKHTAHLLVLIIVVCFTFIELPEIYEVESFPDYYDHVVPYLETCILYEMPTRNGEPTRAPLKWWSLCFSEKLFGNERVIPFLYSIILIPITYSFTTHLTHRKVAGIITILVLVTSGTFTIFDTTSTYEQSWVVFLMVSLIMVLRGNTVGMIIFFALSALSKPIALIYVPVVFAFIYHQHSKHLAILFTIQHCHFDQSNK